MRRAAGTLMPFALAGAVMLAPGLAKATDFGAPSSGPVTWKGTYIGGELGAAFDPIDLGIKDLSGQQDLTLNFSSDTEFIGGVHFGVNWQFGSLLIGSEDDVNFADNINYLATVRGRLGWVSNNWLVYATGGLASIDTDFSATVISADEGPTRFKHSDTALGGVVGGGLEYKATSNLSLGVEGLFYDFGTKTTRLAASHGTEPFILEDNLDFATVRARLSYYFSLGGS
jgi:outer membrane immunogenic protein